MATYPYSSPSPPPPSPCHNKTSPILLPPPPPPPPACNHTTTPTIPSPSPSPSPSPTPTPPCACNKNTTPPPPPPPSSPPPPPHYYPPVHISPPPSTPSPPPPPSPPPVLPPPPSQPPSSSPYYFPQTPLNPPLSPDLPPCHCVCPSPWAAPPNSIPPNSYNQIAPGPMSPSNDQRTVIVTTFVSLGGVFFLAFIVIGLLSMAMKKKMPRMPSGTPQPGSHVQSQGDVHKFESIPASTSTAQTVINMDNPVGLDSKPAENLKVQQGMSLPDPGAGEIVEQGSQETGNPNVPGKMSSDAEFSKPFGDTNMDAPQGAEEGKLDNSNSKLLDENSPTGDADASPNVEEESKEAGDDDSRKKLRLPKKPNSPSKGAKKGIKKRSGLGQVVNAASILEAQEISNDDDDEDQPSEEQPHDDDEKNVKQPAGDEQEAERDAPQGAEEGKLDKSNNRLLDEKSATGDADAFPNVEEGSQEAGDDSKNDSRKKFPLPKKKKSPRNAANKRNDKHSGLSQVANAARILGAQPSPEDDDDEDQPSEEQPTGDEQEAEDHDDKPLINQPEEDDKGSGQNVTNMDGPQEPGDDSMESRNKLPLPKKKKSPCKGMGNDKRSGLSQVANAARILGAQPSLDDDDDEDQPSEEQPTRDEQEAEDHDDKPLMDQPEEDDKGSGQNVTNMDAPQEARDDSMESRNKLPLPKKKKSPCKGKGNDKRSGLSQVANAARILGAQPSLDDDDDEDQPSEEQPTGDEQEGEDRDDKPSIDQPEEDNKGSGQNVEERPVGEESTHSKQNLRLRNKKYSPSKVAKNVDNKRSRVRQGVNIAGTFGLDEADETQDGDKDEEKVSEPEAQGDEEEVFAGKDENVEQPTGYEQKAKERDYNPSIDQPEEDNKGSGQNVEERSVGEESTDSKQKLHLRNKKNSRQGLNIARTFGLDKSLQTQEGDEDEDQVSESEAPGEGEELIADTNENVEQPTADKQEVEDCNDKPLTPRTDAGNQDSGQNVEEMSVGEESIGSKQKLHFRNKKISPSRVSKNGDKKYSQVCQGVNVARTFGLNEADETEDGDEDEEQVSALESQGDEEEFITGTSNNTDENVEQPAADEQDAEERDDKPLIDQLEGNNRDSSQNVEDRSIGEESKDPKQKLRLPNVKKSQGRVVKKEDEKRSRVREGVNIARTFGLDEAQRSQEVDDDEEQVSESKVQVNEEELIGGAYENVEECVVAEQDAEECDNKPQTQQTETDYKDSCQNVEKRLVGEGPNNSKQRSRLPSKKKSLSRVAKKGDQKHSRIGQDVNVARTFGLDEAQQYQDGDDDEEDVRESEARDDEEELIAGTSDNIELDAQDNDKALLLGGPTNTDGNDKVEAEESEFLQDREELNSGFNDSSKIMGSLDDVEGKLKVSEPFSSAQQSKQALKKAMDYKDGKAKVHELKSGGSSKNSQGRHHHTQVREVKKPLNLGKIGPATPGKAPVIFDTADEIVQESEPLASTVDSYLGQLQASAQEIEESPNILQNLTSAIDDDPAEELKSLGDGNFKGKKAQVQKLGKDSRRIKGQIIGPRARIEPPTNLGQSVTARIGDDLSKGLESLEGIQGGGSSKDVPGSGQASRGAQQLSNLFETFTATDEGDPNATLEICEDDDQELEAESSNIEPSPAGEMEPSTDDQSVFVTGDDDPDMLQSRKNEYEEESAESNRDAPPRRPLSRRTTNPRGKRRS